MLQRRALVWVLLFYFAFERAAAVALVVKNVHDEHPAWPSRFGDWVFDPRPDGLLLAVLSSISLPVSSTKRGMKVMVSKLLKLSKLTCYFE